MERLDAIVETVRRYITSELTETLITVNNVPTMIMKCEYKGHPLTMTLEYVPNSHKPLLVMNDTTKKEIKLHNMSSFLVDLESVAK